MLSGVDLIIDKAANVAKTVLDLSLIHIYITIQNQFGFQYIKDFMGFNTIFLLSEGEIQRGRIIATPVENIVLYYVDPNESRCV